MILIESLAWSRPPFQLSIDSWRLEKSQHALITGKSGSGKTTLLKLMCGLESLDKGSISMNGDDPQGSLAAWRRDKIHLVLSDPSLFPDLTLAANLDLHSHMLGEPQDADRKEGLLQQLGLTPLMDRLPENCSSGERQRLTLARAFLHPRPFLLLDEPTSHLSMDHGKEVVNLMKSWAKDDHSTLVMVSHRQEENFDHHLTL